MVAKKTVAKKTVAKKSVARKRSATKKATEMQSFRLHKETTPFTTFRVTRQTVYWVVLLAFIISTQLWILKIQMDISALTDVILAQ
jgi:cell division protein FtsL